METCGKEALMVPGARIELATPAFSGRRSTNELPRQLNFISLVAACSRVNSPKIFPISAHLWSTRIDPMATTTNLKSSDIIPQLDALAKSAASGEALMKSIVALLHENLTRYNCVASYILERDERATLAPRPLKSTL